MTGLKSNLDKEWKQISDLLNSLTLEDGIAPQINIDILLSAIRKFYQNVHDINNVTESSHKRKISELESNIYGIKTAMEDSVKRQERVERAIEDIRQQNINKVIDSSYEKKISDLESNIYGIKAVIEDSIKRQEKVEETIGNIGQQRNFVKEEIVTEEKIEFSHEKENSLRDLMQNEEIISNTKFEDQVDRRGEGIQQKKEESFISETVQDISSEEEGLPQKEMANNSIDVSEMSLEETIIQEGNKTIPENNKEENKQSSLFEYLQANNIEQIKENVSKFIETRNEVKDESKLAIGEKFKQEGPSVIEKITPQTEDRSIGVKIQQQTIRDLRDIIGINEKFLFINELFSGNMKEYTDFIMHLNSLNSKDDVESFLQEVQANRSWIETAHAYITLLQIVKRRFF